MMFLGWEITASRWPWQKGYTWRGSESTAPLGGGARFGGGWRFKLGVDIGGSTVLLNLVFGTIKVGRPPKCGVCGRPLLKGQVKGCEWLMGPGSGIHAECMTPELIAERDRWVQERDERLAR